MPTVTIGNNTGDDFTGAEDCAIDSNNPNTNYNTPSFNYIWEAGGVRYLLSFSGLSNISAPVTVSASTIYIYSHDYGADTLSFRPLLVSFVDSQATWNDRITSTNWPGSAGASTNGTDRRSTVSVTAAIGATGYLPFSSAQLASDTEDQIDGTLNNYGYIIQTNASGYLQHSDFSDGRRPYISVTYTEDSGDDLTASDGYEFSDSVSLIANTNMTMTDIYEFSDTISNTAVVPMNLVDGYQFSDTSQSVAALVMSLSDSHVFSDQVLMEAGNFMNLTDGFEFSDSLDISAGAVLTLSDGFTFADALSVISTSVMNMSDGYILTDIASLDAGLLVEGPVTLSVQVKQSVFTITIKKPTFTTSTKQPNFDIEVN